MMREVTAHGMIRWLKHIKEQKAFTTFIKEEDEEEYYA